MLGSTTPVHSRLSERIRRGFRKEDTREMGTDDQTILSWDSCNKFYLWHTQRRLPPVLIRSFRLDDDAWLRTLNFNLDGSSVHLRSRDDERVDTVSLWDPASRTWHVYHARNDGWVYAKGLGYQRRLGWILPSWRHSLKSEGGILCVLDDINIEQKVVEVDFAGIVEKKSRTSVDVE